MKLELEIFLGVANHCSIRSLRTALVVVVMVVGFRSASGRDGNRHTSIVGMSTSGRIENNADLIARVVALAIGHGAVAATGLFGGGLLMLKRMKLPLALGRSDRKVVVSSLCLYTPGRRCQKEKNRTECERVSCLA